MTKEEAREAIKDAFGNSEYTDELIKTLEQESKTAHWISHREYCEMNNLRPSGLGSLFWCSNCDCGIDVSVWHKNHYNYCPDCGFRMVEPQKSEGQVMADIELIIKIPEEIQLALINNIQLSLDQQSIYDSYIKQAIINGTPLNKDHDKNVVLDKIKADVKKWYYEADKQKLAEDPCVVDAMIDLFIRTINKYKSES